jgi:hypothetical protein
MNGQAWACKNVVDEILVIALPHPGILMKRTDKNPWPKKFDEAIAPRARVEIGRLR